MTIKSLKHSLPRASIVTITFLVLSLMGITVTSSAQDDFDRKENRNLIKDFKIKEIKSYLYPEEGKPGDSILVSNTFFNSDGLCVKEITTEYINTFEYNAEGLKTRETSERKGKTGQSVIVFTYNSKGNLVLSEKVQEGYEGPLNYIYYKHRLTYNSENRLINDEWIDKGGKVQIHERQEYLDTQPDSGVVDMIKYYDMYDHPSYIEKVYKNGRTVMYEIGEQNFISYEQFVDERKRVVRIINNRHMGPHASDAVLRDGHGIIVTSKVTELYRYNTYGLIAEKVIYQDGVVIEKQTWHYIL